MVRTNVASSELHAIDDDDVVDFATPEQPVIAVGETLGGKSHLPIVLDKQDPISPIIPGRCGGNLAERAFGRQLTN